MPGMTVWPASSITCAPAGTGVERAGPTAAIFPSLITIVWSSAGGAPVPSMTRTCVSATVGASTLTNRRVFWESVTRPCCCWAASGSAATTKRLASMRCMTSSFA